MNQVGAGDGSKKLLAASAVSIVGLLCVAILGGYTIYTQNKNTESALRISQVRVDAAGKVQAAVLNMGKAEAELASAADPQERSTDTVLLNKAWTALNQNLQQLQHASADGPRVAELAKLLQQIAPGKVRSIRDAGRNDESNARMELQSRQNAVARIDQISGELVQEENSQLLTAVIDQGSQTMLTLRLLGVLVACCITLGVLVAREMRARTKLISSVNRELSAKALELEISARRHQLLFQRTPMGAFRTTLGGRILEINEAGAQILGYDSNGLSVNGRDAAEKELRWEQLIPRDYELVLQDATRQLKESANCNPFEIEHLRKDGSRVPTLVGLALIEKGGDECVGFMIDLTDRKKAEEALQQSEARLNGVLDAATQVSIIATDPQGLITVFNAGAERLLGYFADEMVGKNTPEILHFRPEVEERSKELSQEFGYPVEGFAVFIEVACQSTYEEREWTYIRKDGGRLAVSLAVTALQDWQGKLAGFLLVAKDITERKRVEEELKSALQMKSDFVSFATHQLRTPLAGIKWLLELAAQEKGVPEEAASFVQDARDASERLIRMVNDLLDASRLEGGKLTLNPKDIDLGELTQNVIADVNHHIQSQEHQLSIHGGSEIPKVQVDPQLFRQVILNLISNAVKYTPHGGKITIEMSQTNGSILWAIHDNGIGIPKAEQARLFEKFFRAENVRKVETEGTGLGLYIVRMVVERSGGKIWCESDEGQGTTFKLELPAKVCLL